MIIKNITLYNFRQYKGEHTINFSTDKEKNVTVILGINTSGKTTLIQAFNWCLYEKSTFKTREVINVEIAQSMSLYSVHDVFVEVVIMHEDKEFVIRRSQEFTKNEYGKVKTSSKTNLKVQYKEKNGEQQSISEKNEGMYLRETIDKILPESLSDYFFFDGERISDINNRGDVVAAVRGLMGLDVISSAMDRLDPTKSSSVISKLNSELDVGNGQDSNKSKSNLTGAQNKLEGFIKRKEIVKEEIEFFERRKQELSAKLLENKDVKVKQKIKIDLEKDILVIGKNITTSENRIKSDFSIGAMKYFAAPLIKRALSVIEEAKQDGEGIPEMRAKAIDHILERGRCLCGCDLEKNEGAREKILYEKSLLPPQHMGTILRTHKQAYQRFLRESHEFDKVIIEDYANFRSNINLLEEKKEALINVSEQIKGVIDVQKIEDDYQKNEKELNNKRYLLESINTSIGSTQNEITNIEKKIEGLALVSTKNQKLTKSIAYAKAIYEWFKASYDIQEKEVKDLLLRSVNDIFEKMYHGKRRVSINEKYQINLITMVGEEGVSTDESKGLESVKNFSFISGLVDLARQKARTGKVINNEDDFNVINDDGELAISTEPYPLVMDAPFSNVDEIHINNIAKIIPEVAEQVILVLMRKDWEFAKNALEEKVGYSYIIEKIGNSDTNSTIRRML